jgi:hypothetical protein
MKTLANTTINQTIQQRVEKNEPRERERGQLKF